MEAFKAVKSNGSAGVDGISIKDIESNPRKYLYPLFVRMASGAITPCLYARNLFPSMTERKGIGHTHCQGQGGPGGHKEELESIVDKQFSVNSFGYRPNMSAIQAVEQCRINCMKFNWAIDLDIKGFFDNIDHLLIKRAIRRFTTKRHITLYIARWLKAPVQIKDGSIKLSEGKGTPQGGVISPLLANIFLHFGFDTWFEETFSDLEFERYSDDIIIN